MLVLLDSANRKMHRAVSQSAFCIRTGPIIRVLLDSANICSNFPAQNKSLRKLKREMPKYIDISLFDYDL